MTRSRSLPTPLERDSGDCLKALSRAFESSHDYLREERYIIEGVLYVTRDAEKMYRDVTCLQEAVERNLQERDDKSTITG